MLWAELEHYQSYGPVTPTVLFGKIVFQSASNLEFEYHHIRDHTNYVTIITTMLQSYIIVKKKLLGIQV